MRCVQNLAHLMACNYTSGLYVTIIDGPPADYVAWERAAVNPANKQKYS